MTASTVADSDVRLELARVLASSTFAASDRHRNFLSYNVEETLAGRSDRIKAYTIATMALGRGEDFDPQNDSIVRIDAGRLRRALDHYYLTEGSQDPVRIIVPKGSYVPCFHPAGADEASGEGAPAPRAGASRRGPHLFVAPFEQEGSTAAVPNLGRGFTRQVITGLTRFSNLFVYGAETAEMMGNQGAPGKLSGGLDVDFVLSGSISVTPERFTVEVLLQERPEGRYVWTDRFEGDFSPPDLARTRDTVANEVVRKLAQPYGVLFSRCIDQEGNAPERLDSYRAVLDFYLYWRRFERALYEPVRAGLERAIAEDPTFAEAYACLAQHYTNAGRFALGLTVVADPLGRARQLADQAVRLAPHSSAAHHALGLVRWFSGDVLGSLAAYRTAISLNPSDTDIMADFGFRCTMRMDWQTGVPLIEESYRRNPCQPTTYRVGLFLHHFSEGRYEQALDQARMVDAPDVVYGHLGVAAAAAGAERMAEAREAWSRLERLVPDYGSMMERDLLARSLHPDLIEALATALRRAGFPVKAPAGRAYPAPGPPREAANSQ